MQIKVGDIVSAKVSGIAKFGVFVILSSGENAMIHISELSDGFIRDISDFYQIGMELEAVVIAASENGKINLSVKSLAQNKLKCKGPDEFSEKSVHSLASFEDMLNKFKQESEQKCHDLKKSYESKRGSLPRKK